VTRSDAVNKSRLEAFSDGVFAFAVTLLILGVVLPVFSGPPTNADLGAALLALWPKVLAYALSFAVIGIMWQNHQALFRLVERIDRQTVFWNLVLLGFTVFIPFATSTAGSYWWLRWAAVLYGLVLTCCSTAFNLLLNHLIRSGAFHASVNVKTIRGTVIAYRVGWITYVGAMLVAFISPIASFALYFGIVLYYLIPHGLERDIRSQGSIDSQ
jgi:uncharacterized membrane protein